MKRILSLATLFLVSLDVRAMQDGAGITDRIQQRIAATLTIDGDLLCDASSQKSGAAECDLLVRDKKTGKTYVLNQSDSARSLAVNGQTRVRINGQVNANNTLLISSIRALGPSH